MTFAPMRNVFGDLEVSCHEEESDRIDISLRRGVGPKVTLSIRHAELPDLEYLLARARDAILCHGPDKPGDVGYVRLERTLGVRK